MLVDEVLSVGDSNFSKKCLSRIMDLKKAGTTVILVSHDENTVRSFCSRAYLLSKGEVVFEGACNDVLIEHHKVMDERMLAYYKMDAKLHSELDTNAIATNSNQIPKASVQGSLSQLNQSVSRVEAHQPFDLKINLTLRNAQNCEGEINVGFGFNTLDGRRILGRNLRQLGRQLLFPHQFANDQTSVEVVFSFPSGLPWLASGNYRLYLGVVDCNDSRSLVDHAGIDFIVHNKTDPLNGYGDILACHDSVQ